MGIRIIVQSNFHLIEYSSRRVDLWVRCVLHSLLPRTSWSVDSIRFDLLERINIFTTAAVIEVVIDVAGSIARSISDGGILHLGTRIAVVVAVFAVFAASVARSFSDGGILHLVTRIKTKT